MGCILSRNFLCCLYVQVFSGDPQLRPASVLTGPEHPAAWKQGEDQRTDLAQVPDKRDQSSGNHTDIIKAGKGQTLPFPAFFRAVLYLMLRDLQKMAGCTAIHRLCVSGHFRAIWSSPGLFFKALPEPLCSVLYLRVFH